MQKTLKIDGSWSSPGGEAKLFKGENVILKWYGPTRKKLVVQEDREDCSVENILQCLCRGVEKSQIDAQISIEASEGMNIDQHIYKTELASLKLELSTVWAVVNRIQDTILVKLDEVNSDKENQLVKIRNEFDKIRLEHESQIKLLNVKLDDISGDRECVETNNKLDDLKDANCELINENSRLKNVNYQLTSKIEELSQKLTDLQEKAIHTEEERDSLIAVVRLLAVESNQPLHEKKTHALHHNNDDQQIASNDDLIQSSEQVNQNIKLSNRYSGFNDTVVVSEDPDESNKEENLNSSNTQNKLKKKQKKGKKKQKPADTLVRTEQQQNIKASVVVAGDSIIKYLKGWELSNGEQNVSIKSFSGATVDDMSDFLKPTIRKKPNKLIIHAGTNDVRHSSPKVIAEKVTKLGENFRKESSQTEIIISSLVTRGDSQELAIKVRETNNILKSKCASKNWLFLDNSNIDRSFLNYRGLHLNHNGSKLLQENIANILTSHR